MFHFSIWNTPMSNAVESQKVADEKKGWKGLLIAAILSVLFLGIFYLAMASQQQKNASQQHAFKTAPTMSSHTSAEQSHSIENHEHVMNDAASSAQAH